MQCAWWLLAFFTLPNQSHSFALCLIFCLPPAALVYISGVVEILLGIGLLIPATQQLSAWGLVALFIAVYPANLNMAFKPHSYQWSARRLVVSGDSATLSVCAYCLGLLAHSRLQSRNCPITSPSGASQFCKSALIPQPLLLRTVSDLRASYVLRTASNGLLPKWEKGSRSQSPSPALGEGFRVRAEKGGVQNWDALISLSGVLAQVQQTAYHTNAGVQATDAAHLLTSLDEKKQLMLTRNRPCPGVMVTILSL